MAIFNLSLGSRHRTMYGRTLFVVVVMLCEALVASGQPCPTGHYMAPGDSPGGQCKPCSSCPLNQIIRKPCTAYRDNVCGPFYEFEFFNQGHHESRSMPPSFAVTPTKTADSAAGNVQEAKAGLVSSVDNDGEFTSSQSWLQMFTCHQTVGGKLGIVINIFNTSDTPQCAFVRFAPARKYYN